LKSTEPDPEDQRTVNSQQLLELEKLARQKIEIWARDGRLRDHPRLVPILYDWRRWSPPGEQVVQAFVKELASTDEGLITLIAGFTGRSYVTGFSDYVSREESKINLGSLEEWISVTDIEPRIRAIFQSERFNHLTAGQQKGLKTFINSVDDKKVPT
jgi:predicted KAP-like P-loop ATPase